jgi:type IV secretion system protein VirB8
MSKKTDYYERAGSWASDTRLMAARSRRIAWTVAGVAVAVAAFEAVALALLAPLKTVQPITLLVDRQTGYVQALDPLQPRRVNADEALTQASLAQYVVAREGFDRATVKVDYRKVALWSEGRARASYVGIMPATNPASPFRRYPAGATVLVRVKSVSRLSQGTAMVRFDTQLQDRSGRVETPQSWVSVVRYHYSDAPMSLEDRLVNPLGFQVTGYRRDAEAPPLPETPSGDPDGPPAGHGTAAAYMPAAGAGMHEVNVGKPDQMVVVAKSQIVPSNLIPTGSPLSPLKGAR